MGDGLARIKSAGRTSEILVLYVNDMGSDAVGDMGAPELVPFSDQTKADEFMNSNGGGIVRFADISSELALPHIDIGRPSDEPT